MEKDMQIIQGDTCYLTITKLDDAGDQSDFENGEVVVFSAKKNLKQEDYDIHSENATLIDGQMVIELTPEQTNIALGDYYYDIQYVNLAKDVYTLVKGTLTIDWDVSD